MNLIFSVASVLHMADILLSVKLFFYDVDDDDDNGERRGNFVNYLFIC